MTTKNNVLIVAAYNGAVGGSNAGAALNTNVQATLTAAAVALGNEIDSLIDNDATISNEDGTALLPTTSTEQGNILAKVGLMESLCFAACQNHPLTDATQADYATMAAAIVARYNAGVT